MQAVSEQVSFFFSEIILELRLSIYITLAALLFINDQVKEGTVTYLNHGGGLE